MRNNSSSQPPIQNQQISPKAQWFIHDRFGLFIHWGVYAASARYGREGSMEWTRSFDEIDDAGYQRYFDTFNPDLYDPKTWAHDAKEAGMRYAVITTKHHDGFCLWDSQLTDFCASHTPAGQDLLRPWVEAFREAGLKVGFYYSLIDWHHPQFSLDRHHPLRRDPQARQEVRDIAQYVAYMQGQLRELLTNYGIIDILWFDFSYPEMEWEGQPGKGRNDWQAEQLVQLVRTLMPNILINNRLDLPEEADFITPEQLLPSVWPERDGQRITWETCQTLNDNWGYNRDDQHWKSPEMVVRLLIDTVSKGGNLLLNVGPTARGVFDPHSQAILATVGRWMQLHSTAIYGATASRYSAPPDTRLTQQGNHLYLHLFTWPLTFVFLDNLEEHILFARFVHDGSEIRFTRGPQVGSHTIPTDIGATTITLHLPSERPDVLVPVIELLLRED